MIVTWMSKLQEDNDRCPHISFDQKNKYTHFKLYQCLSRFTSKKRQNKVMVDAIEYIIVACNVHGKVTT